MRFAKGHGTENDFVILLDPDGSLGLTAGLAARLCDRRAGIGGDGVLRAVRTGACDPGWPAAGAAGPGSSASDAAGPEGGGAEAEWFMDYRNADGSLAEMCGNGIRVFARYLARHGLVAGPEFTVATRSGPRRVRLDASGDITADMGAVAVLGPGSAVLAGQAYPGLRVSVGNPHLACLVEGPLAAFDLSRPPVLDAGLFPEGGNVELVRVTGARSVAMRVHERGSGETRSCGTGAVAAAAAAAATANGHGGNTWESGTANPHSGNTWESGTANPHSGDNWQVTVPGGTLGVTLDAGRAWLTGPAVIVAEGQLDPSWLAAVTDVPAAR
jgi:diaminopimelate epimerase